MRTLGRHIWQDSTRSPIRTPFELYISLSELDLTDSSRLTAIWSWDIAKPQENFWLLLGIPWTKSHLRN